MVTSLSKTHLFIWAGCIALLVMALFVAANARVPVRFELECEFSTVELELVSRPDGAALTPALPVGEVTLDLVSNIAVPGGRIAAHSQVRQADVMLQVRNDIAARGAVRISPAIATTSTCTIRPIRLAPAGQLKLQAEGGQLIMVLTKLSERVSLVAPSPLLISPIAPAWVQGPVQQQGKPGNAVALKGDSTGTSSLLRVNGSPSLLVAVTTGNAADLGGVISDRVRFSKIAFRVADHADGRLRSTLTARPVLRFPSAPDFKIPAAAASDILMVRSEDGVQFSTAKVREQGGLSASNHNSMFTEKIVGRWRYYYAGTLNSDEKLVSVRDDVLRIEPLGEVKVPVVSSAPLEARACLLTSPQTESFLKARTGYLAAIPRRPT